MMTPARQARLALRCMFMATELLGELELAPPLDRLVRQSLDGTILGGAALEKLVTELRGIERRASSIEPRAKRAKKR